MPDTDPGHDANFKSLQRYQELKTWRAPHELTEAERQEMDSIGQRPELQPYLPK